MEIVNPAKFKQKYKLLVFDWDGTLMDSSAKIINCFNGASEDVGVDLPDSEQVKSYIGLSLAEAFSRLYSDHSEHVISNLVSRYREHWLFHDSTPMPLFSRVEEGLRQLDADGYLLSVATGKSHQGLVRALTETDLEDLFVYTRCADQSRSKPDPQMLFDTLDFCGLDKSEAVMIGDTTFDLEMALNAGMDSWGMGYGSHSENELQVFSRYPIQNSFSDFIDRIRASDE